MREPTWEYEAIKAFDRTRTMPDELGLRSQACYGFDDIVLAVGPRENDHTHTRSHIVRLTHRRGPNARNVEGPTRPTVPTRLTALMAPAVPTRPGSPNELAGCRYRDNSVFDDRVREQPFGQLTAGSRRRLGVRGFDAQAESFTSPHSAHARKTERGQGSLDRRPLGVRDPWT